TGHKTIRELLIAANADVNTTYSAKSQLNKLSTSWSAANNPNSETNIGVLAKMYEDNSDVAPAILALLNPQELEQLAIIGYKKRERFHKLWQDATQELLKHIQQFLRKHNGNLDAALF